MCFQLAAQRTRPQLSVARYAARWIGLLADRIHLIHVDLQQEAFK
jgi:hypothetical protein